MQNVMSYKFETRFPAGKTMRGQIVGKLLLSTEYSYQVLLVVRTINELAKQNV